MVSRFGAPRGDLRGQLLLAVVSGVLVAAMVALFHLMRGDEPQSFVQMGVGAAGIALGAFLGGLIRSRLIRSAPKRRSAGIWALGLGVFGALLFASIGLLNGAVWTGSQWTIAAISGAVLGSICGAAWAWGWNAVYVRKASGRLTA